MEWVSMPRQERPNPPLERDRRQPELAGSLHGFAAPAAPQLLRYVQSKIRLRIGRYYEQGT